MDRGCATHMQEYYSVIKKNILTFVATWMNPEDIILSKISQIQKDKQIPHEELIGGI